MQEIICQGVGRPGLKRGWLLVLPTVSGTRHGDPSTKPCEPSLLLGVRDSNPPGLGTGRHINQSNVNPLTLFGRPFV